MFIFQLYISTQSVIGKLDKIIKCNFYCNGVPAMNGMSFTKTVERS